MRKVAVWYEETGIPVTGDFGPFPRSSAGLINSLGAHHDCWATLDYTVTY